MTDTITLSRERASEIVKAVNGIGELLKALPAKPENAAVLSAVRHHVESRCDSDESGRSAARKLELTPTVRLDKSG